MKELKKQTGEEKKMCQKTFNTIFLSHATPEDNYFVSWLVSKLRFMGYKVWCDIEELKGGEDFWQEIQKKIRNETIKFLFVVSKDSIKKDGALKELAFADQIKDRGDFIIPLRFNNNVASKDLPIEIVRRTYIDFSENWAKGLERLIDKFETEKIKKENKGEKRNILEQWFKSNLIKKNVLNRQEKYISNWFKIVLPERIYIHSNSRIDYDRLDDFNYPYRVDKNIILTFSDIDFVNNFLEIKHSITVGLKDFIEDSQFKVPGTNLIIKDTQNKLKELLNKAFSFYLRNKGLKPANLSVEKDVYYFPYELVEKRISLKEIGGTNISLAGKKKNYNWHFAINGVTFLHPFPGVIVKSHVVFTEDNNLVEKKIQHSLRRNLCNDWYNKKWKNLLRGTMFWLSNNRNERRIDIQISPIQYLRINILPVEFVSPVGYNEPLK